MNNRFIPAALTAALGLALFNGSVAGDAASVDLLLDPPTIGTNRFDITVSALGSMDSQSMDISGNAMASLELTYNADQTVNSVTELSFTGGALAATDEMFELLGGLITVTTSNVGGQAITPTPPGTVTGSSFPTNQHAIELNQGTITPNVDDPIDLSASPIIGTTNDTGTLNVSLSSIDVNNLMAAYDVELILPVDFNSVYILEDVPLLGNVNVNITVNNGSVRARGQFTRAITCAAGDTDCDGDIDTGDLTTAIQNFTGAGGSGKQRGDGDTDNDGDVDTGDITNSIINFTGANALNAGVPDLVYDPATGNVTIDADGADVISFSLQAGPFNAADFSELPAGLTDNIATQIGWTSFNLFSGLTGTADLGAILPAGLDLAGLEAALQTASYGLALAGGGGGGRLDLVVPEPGSVMILTIGSAALIRRRRAA